LGFGELMGSAPEIEHKPFEFIDTFLSTEHLKESFPSKEIKFIVDDKDSEIKPPFRISIKESDEEDEPSIVQVEPFQGQNYTLFDPPKVNNIRYTPAQVDAIVSAMSPGLTVVSGATGTGKTEVAAEIITNLYRNFNHEKILVLVKSESALEALLYKLTERG
jgi:intron-binding protein aquarius